jgi:hypothetical protein
MYGGESRGIRWRHRCFASYFVSYAGKAKNKTCPLSPGASAADKDFYLFTREVRRNLFEIGITTYARRNFLPFPPGIQSIKIESMGVPIHQILTI